LENIVFSTDRPLFLVTGDLLSESGASLWSLGGESLGSTGPAKVEWAAFTKGGASLVIGLWPDLSPDVRPNRQIKLFDIDGKNRLIRPGKVFDAAGFDWSLLNGATVPTRVSVEAPVVHAGPNQTRQALPCERATGDFKIGVGICVLKNAAPVLFNTGSRDVIGELLQWEFGDAGREIWFSPDGRTLLLAGSQDRVTAWDVATRTLKWNLPGRPTPDTRFSADGKRLLLPSYIDNAVLVVDVATGATLANLTQPNHNIVWIDTAGKQAIARARTNGSGIRLTYWNVESLDKQKAMRSLEVASHERTEYEQDTQTLNKSPSTNTLLEIARRRLRRCG
jgi:hypothetical protein